MSSRELVINILYQVFEKGSYSNIVLNSALKKSELNDKDKALVTEIVYGTIKYKYTIDSVLSTFIRKGLKNLNSNILNILRSAIYQIRYLDKVPDFAVVNEAVELSKKYSSIKTSKFVNGVLRNYLRNKNKKYCNCEDILQKLCFTYSFPKWMVQLFIKQYGEEKAEQICKGLNEVPDVTVRINNLKTSYEEITEKLINLGYELEDGNICPEAIRILKGKSIESNPLFKEGYMTVQDESAMLVAPIMDIEKNMKVLDLCSAPGGKSTHISEIMDNTGQVLSYDIHKTKLDLIKQNIKRLGITNITCDVMNASKFNKNLENSADRVLIDVPCSGLGIIRKKPEIKWNKNLKELKQLVRIQRNILVNASIYVKQNGILIYSTCTLNKDENEKNIEWFIKQHPKFKVESIYFGNLDNVLYNKKGYVTILPNKSMDGFFIAKLRKQW
ncbi:16S rRNA (cytosine(967)-C(5))-methyltransferase RsmB [Haloimpatiens sp. FM7330]|uniref:16S rRNA (cytosine(967)-C(5))-methyltransferase RsmB n=1 Tax=Haloimpatiens sp. FM7330 TaxID=3298610 RepID=UPI0036368982